MLLRAALYLRVSTDKQSTANQRPEVEQLVRARGFEVVQVYEEQASAAKHRPKYEAMLKDARRGKFQVLVVWALDRFGRSMVGNLQDGLAYIDLDDELMNRCLVLTVDEGPEQTRAIHVAQRSRETLAGVLARRDRDRVTRVHRNMFRHTAATLMLEGGADIRYVQTMLGHAQLESTAIYTHVSILKLLEVYEATHPAARIGHAPAKAKVRDEALARAEAAELLSALDDEAVEEDPVANATTET